MPADMISRVSGIKNILNANFLGQPASCHYLQSELEPLNLKLIIQAKHRIAELQTL